MTAVAVRRLHVYADASMKVRCPDCGYRFFDVVDRAGGGCFEVVCKCKDDSGRARHWLLIFHEGMKSLYDAVRYESSVIDIANGENN